MIKVGKYTSALLLIILGSALLVDLTMDTDYISKLVAWWPVILIGIGIEYLVLSAIYRDPDKKLRLAFGSIFMSVLLSIVVIGVISGSSLTVYKSINLEFGSFGFANEDGLKYTLPVTKAELDDSVETVYLNNVNGNVAMKPGDVSVIQIETTLYVPKMKKSEAGEIANQSTLSVKRNGGKLEIATSGKTYRIFGIKQKPRMNLVVTVPRDRAANYELDLSNGKVEADGVPVLESLKADTTNGSITVRNVQGDVTADTTNGTITITDIEGNVAADTTNGKIVIERVAGIVKTDTTNGDIQVTDADNAVSADTTNGKITVRTSQLGGNWKLDTTNGKIEIYLPEDASFEMDGETIRMSNISSDFPLNVNKDEVTGSVNGGQYRIRIDTNSGIGIYKNK